MGCARQVSEVAMICHRHLGAQPARFYVSVESVGLPLPVLTPSAAVIVGKDDTTAATFVVPWPVTSPAALL